MLSLKAGEGTWSFLILMVQALLTPHGRSAYPLRRVNGGKLPGWGEVRGVAGGVGGRTVVLQVTLMMLFHH